MTDPAPAALRVMTFNIRYGNADDGPDSWPDRRSLVVRTLQDNHPHVLGVQEALRFQLDALATAFPGLAEVGVGRDDGLEAGEYSAILFDRTRLELLDQGTFWLSETPDVPGSMTWGNRYPRVVTWARFRDGDAGPTFTVVNTHWDHESQNARERSAAAVLGWLAARADDDPVVVMGDFNAGESNPAFRALVDDPDAALRDSFREVHPDASPVGTFHGFSGDPGGDKIDAVLVSPEWRVLDAEIVRTRSGDRYPSDHFPVTGTVRLGGG
ncbi:MAG: endonuclease/exonuclease/phosphatase family protein [Gemmatimonadota bacterium]